MKKITELIETRRRTVHNLDAYGNRVRDTEEYLALRPVRSVAQGPRFGHYIADSILFQLIIYFVMYLSEIVATIFSSNVYMDLTVSFVFGITLMFLYPALYAFCEYNWQRTPGKFLTKTLVIDEYGNKPDLKTIILRSIIRIVPFEPVSCLNDDFSHGWHDRWSKTWVVSEEELKTLKKLQEEQSDLNP
jgi:uncharacterized RDD family membrane protein YckC